MNKADINLTIIIPVYNTQNYVKKCLDTIVDSVDDENVEIICIDDGSKDASYEICKLSSLNDTRIKVIHQENKGVSITRNRGIEMAAGKWILFVDSDDTVTGELQRAINILDDSFDIMMFNSEWENQKCNSILTETIYGEDKHKYLVSRMMESKNITETEQCSLRSPCFKFYNKKFIDRYRLKFVENIAIGEDFLFNLNAVCKANRIKHTSLCIYKVIARDGSATHSFMNDCFIRERVFLDELKTILVKENLFDELQHLFYSEAKSSIMRCIRKQLFHKDNKISLVEKKQQIDEMLKFGIYKEALCIRDNNFKRELVLSLFKCRIVWLLAIIPL